MSWDAIIVGSGPNGLSAAAHLLREGFSVLALEAADTLGGGVRTAELTLEGFKHDLCSAVHPMGVLSPFMKSLPLAEHGLEWLSSEVSVAHPLDDRPAPLLMRSMEQTCERLGSDADRWRGLISPFLKHPDHLFHDLLGPLRIPRRPFTLARFGWYGLRSARSLARGLFQDEAARALFAGCAGHSILSFDKLLSAAVGLVFSVSGHVVDWPVARGGSQAIADALSSYCRSMGGELRTGSPVTSLAELPPSRVVLFDVAPKTLVSICGDALPAGYVRRLARYRYGPGVFKLDWALSGPIPWRDPAVGRASTVHVGGTLDEVAASEGAMWRGEVPDKPFLILCQQSALDPSRAPTGKHTGYAYCHVPAGCTVDMTAAIEAQVERFAPGFRDLILARHAWSPAGFEAHNPSYVGGAITGGVADLGQLFTRPIARLNPYTTPNPRLFLCGQATPPGGGVHGLCGYFGARAAVKRLRM